ncbi:hypothetical protein M3649_17765 [Ureibacillus chungkukjangi]|uniref:hypothetical protein n=1 Tax=Ureibacillus chungkukjangi TaxID=1202712 RepID=UPI00203CE728|nr:hypothetical protein [Ureibacillus chungkukjangi]MCM3389969.1 hypothetical protein [Ureibacillus chungkukjangi]
MAVIQVFLKVSDEIMSKIDSGENKRIGGVVRFSEGPIVKHLRDATMTEVVLHYALNNRDTIVKVGKGSYKLTRLLFRIKEKKTACCEI